MNAKLLSKNKLSLQTLFWIDIPYQSKVRLQEFEDLVDIFTFSYQVNDRTLQGLLIEPRDKSKKYPTIIFNRGGNNTNPENSDMGITLGPLAGAGLFSMAANNGYTIYMSQFSGYGPNSGKDEFGGEDLNDIAGLKELINQNPICDKDKVGMIGYSRGGLMTYLSLLSFSWLKTTAIVGGPTDEIRGLRERPEMQKVYELAFEICEEELRKRSIIYHAEKLPNDANILMLHGAQDDRVNPQDSIDLSKKLEELGINHKLVIFPGGSHSLMENKIERNKEILDWFDKHLKTE